MKNQVGLAASNGKCFNALTALAAAVILAFSPPAWADEAKGEKTKTPKQYELDYFIRLDPAEGEVARVTIKLGEGAEALRSIRFHIDPDSHSDFKGDGKVEFPDEEHVLWDPPKKGGKLRYLVHFEHLRDTGGYDAIFEENWALFRGDDLVPPARVRTRGRAESNARLHFRLPKTWLVQAPFPLLKKGKYEVEREGRRFDRPTGWMVVGEIGVRRETIAGRDIAVAGPRGHNVRRLDILAFLNWNLPLLVEVFPEFPPRLLIVSASDPMWRGGLSGPSSLYIHADRPLISENGTSTLLHELIHVGTALRGGPGDDWIVEGLAEFYAVEIMKRSGTITAQRFEIVHQKLAEWGKDADRLQQARADGPIKARAVGLFRTLDGQIRSASGGRASLDDVVRELQANGPEVTLKELRAIAEKIAGQRLVAFTEGIIAKKK